jgi:hypothetical protein
MGRIGNYIASNKIYFTIQKRIQVQFTASLCGAEAAASDSQPGCSCGFSAGQYWLAIKLSDALM